MTHHQRERAIAVGTLCKGSHSQTVAPQGQLGVLCFGCPGSFTLVETTEIADGKVRGRMPDHAPSL